MKKILLTALGAFTAVTIATGQAAKPSAPPAHVPAHAGEASDPDCVKKTCVPEPAKTKTVKPVYNVKRVKYCLPKCPHSCLLHPHKCCPTCGKPRTRRVLVKGFVTAERDTFKCVPQPICTNP